jgi:DNA-binding Xre family transcriptional regulator
VIRNDREYQEAVRQNEDQKARLGQHQAALEREGLARDEVERAMQPLRTFQLQQAEDIEVYERLRRGDLQELANFKGVGQALIALRIVRGMSQRDLAERLGVDESQVSRDERNEYSGITLERLQRVLAVLRGDLRVHAFDDANHGAS